MQQPPPTHLCRSRQGRLQPLCGAQGIPDRRLHSDHELKRGRITCQDCLAAYPAAKALDDARAEARGMRYLLYDARRPLVLPRAAPQGALRVLIIDRLVHACGRWNIEAAAQWLRAGRGGLGRLPLRLARGYMACAIAGSPRAARRCLARRRPAAPLPRGPRTSPGIPGSPRVAAVGGPVAALPGSAPLRSSLRSKLRGTEGRGYPSKAGCTHTR